MEQQQQQQQQQGMDRFFAVTRYLRMPRLPRIRWGDLFEKLLIGFGFTVVAGGIVLVALLIIFSGRLIADSRYDWQQTLHEVCEIRGQAPGARVEVVRHSDTEVHACPDPAAYGNFQDFDAWYATQ